MLQKPMRFLHNNFKVLQSGAKKREIEIRFKFYSIFIPLLQLFYESLWAKYGLNCLSVFDHFVRWRLKN